MDFIIPAYWFCCCGKYCAGIALVKVQEGGRKPYLQTLLAITASTILAVYGSTYVGHPYGLAALLSGLAIFTYVLYTEYRRSLNLIKQVFERWTFLAYIVALLNYVATYALAIAFSNYLQLSAGFTAREAGLILLAQLITQALLSPLAGYLADRANPGYLVTTGMGLITLGIGISTVMYRWVDLLIIPLIILGAGFTLFASPNTTQIMRRIPREAFASAFLGLMRFLGQSLSTSILTAIILASKASIPVIPMEVVLMTYTAISAIGTAVAVISIRKD